MTMKNNDDDTVAINAHWMLFYHQLKLMYKICDQSNWNIIVAIEDCDRMIFRSRSGGVELNVQWRSEVVNERAPQAPLGAWRRGGWDDDTRLSLFPPSPTSLPLHPSASFASIIERHLQLRRLLVAAGTAGVHTKTLLPPLLSACGAVSLRSTLMQAGQAWWLTWPSVCGVLCEFCVGGWIE